jgi:hypothetical protein
LRPTPNLEGQVSVFMFPSDRVAQLYPQASGFLYIAFHDSQRYRGGVLIRLHTGKVRITLKNRHKSNTRISESYKPVIQPCRYPGLYDVRIINLPMQFFKSMSNPYLGICPLACAIASCPHGTPNSMADIPLQGLPKSECMTALYNPFASPNNEVHTLHFINSLFWIDRMDLQNLQLR